MKGVVSPYKSCDIIIPIHNAWHLARPCVDSVLKYTDYSPHQVLLVDDGSDAVTAERMADYASKYPDRIKVIRNERALGFVRACNRGMRQSAADYVVLLNSDTCVTPGWLTKMVRCMESDPRIGVASPISNHCPHMRIPMAPGADFLRMAELLEAAHQPEYPDIFTPEGFCFMISRVCMETVGYFDEVFDFGYCEETDFSIRAHYYGFRTVCVDDVYIYHKGSGSFGVEERNERYNRNKAILFRRWKNKFAPAHDAFKANNPVVPVRQKVEALAAQRQPGKTGVDHHRLHILCVLPTLNPYGGVISVVNMINHFVELGHHCTLVSLSPCDHHPHTLYTEPVYAKDRTEIARRFAGRYDALIATSWETVDPVVQLARTHPENQTFYFVQDFEVRFYEEDDPRRPQILQSYDQIETRVVKTQHLEEVLARHGWKAHRIRPGINLDLFYPRQKNRDGRMRVLAMARPDAVHRGFDLVIATLEQVWRARPDVDIVLFGGKDLGSRSIPFPFVDAGVVPPHQLASLYASADVFLEMSRNHGFGRTGVEAMACGTACVLSDSGGIRAYARHEENALIVPVGNTEEAAAQVLRLLQDEALRLRLVQSGLETVRPWTDRGAAEDFLGIILNNRR